MSEYRVFETRQFQRDLREIARAGAGRIEEKLRRAVYPQLRRCPHFGPGIRKLRGYEPDTRRVRIGSWRFFHQVDDERRIVFMIAAAHRGSAY